MIREMVFEKAAAFQVLCSEVLQYSALTRNLAENFRRLPKAFDATSLRGKFKNIPAIVCGAGPSLQKEAALLQTMQQKAVVIAGGSAITVLHSLGIKPHFGMAVDPNPEELIRLKNISSTDMPLLYANRVCPEIFPLFKGPIGPFCSSTGGPFETWMEKKLNLNTKSIGADLKQEAFSVTTLAIAMACAMGCDPIILAGVDLAYTDGRRYSSGVDEGGHEGDILSALDNASEKKIKRGVQS